MFDLAAVQSAVREQHLDGGGALDDVMANWLYLRGHRAVTGRCDLRYKTSLPTGTAVNLRSWCIKSRRKVASMAAEMRRADNDQLIAECEANFMIVHTP